MAQLNDEIQALARNLRVKDQTIQETSVKVELMERRMETVKKQADTITDLENELSKARKQERAYEEAMEQLQADLDALEQDNAKLKTLASNPERQPSTTQAAEAESVPTEGNLETSYLLEQVSPLPSRLRAVLRFLSDRCAAWHGTLPPKRELLPQGPRPPQRDRGPPRAPPVLPVISHADATARAFDALRLGRGLGLGRRAPRAADAARARGREQAAVPRGDPVRVRAAARRPLRAPRAPHGRGRRRGRGGGPRRGEGVAPAQEDASVPAVRAQDAGRAARPEAQGSA